MWKLPYTVNMDSPSHLYTSHVAAELLFKPGSHYSKFYELNSPYLPNWGTTFFLSFLNLFLPSLGAERMLKTILPLLFGSVVYCVLHQRSSHPIILIPLFYPLIFSSFFSAGFYGFYIGIVLCICLLRFLLPHPADVSVGGAILFSLMLVATYYSHLLTFVLGMVFLLCSVAVDSVLDAKRATTVTSSTGRLVKIQRASSRGLTCFFWDARWFWLASLPSLLLMVMQLRESFSLLKGLQVSISGKLLSRVYEALTFTNSFDSISWDWRVKVFTIVQVVSLFAFALGKRRPWSERVWRREECKLLVLSGVGMVLFLFSPDTIGEGEFVGARILYATFLLMMLFGACHLTRREAWICCLVWIVPFALLQQRAVYKASQVFQPYVLQLQETARHITQCTAILYLPYKTFEPYLDEYPWTLNRDWPPFRHLGGYLALQTETVLLNNYEGMTNYFPLRLRPTIRSRELEELPDEFVPAKFSALKSFVVHYRHLVDCVLIWETDHGSVEELEKTRIREFLSSSFRLIYESRLPAPLVVYAG
jgi:hypothetical protein